MNKFEKSALLLALLNLTALFVVQVFVVQDAFTPRTPFLFSWGIGSILFNWFAMFLTIRDLYRRDFPECNTKLTWCLLILLTGGIGFVVYVFKHALKPRPRFADRREGQPDF